MGIFGSNDSTIQEKVEQATTEKNLEEDWELIMQICDEAGKLPDQAKPYLRAILKRLYNPDPHIGLKAVTLLDALVKNSEKTFLIEVASREFEDEFTKLMSRAPSAVSKKLRESLKRWAENEFANDPQLSLIPSLYAKLKSSYDFSASKPIAKKTVPLSKDPNVVESQEEEEQILKAIELSLKDSGSPRNTAASINQSSSLYPSVNMAASANSSNSNTNSAKEPRKVRALYDFEAAEDNELTFTSGEIILVIDDSDPNWWKGSNHRGEGLFPANFVTADLTVEPEKYLYEKAAKRMVQFKENAEVNIMKDEPEDVEIDEQKIDRLLYLLHEADPTNPEKDTEEMLNLEREVNLMGPLIDAELERVDRKHAQLTQLSTDLVDALSLYHSLMREPTYPVDKIMYNYGPASTQMHFNGSLPQSMPMPMMGPQGHERPPFMHHTGGPPGLAHQHPPNQAPVAFSHMPGINNIPPPMPMNEPFNRPGMPPNFGPPSVGQPSFQQPGAISQTNIPNGVQQQGPNFVASSTHLSH